MARQRTGGGWLRHLRRDEQGVTLVEFAFVGPVFILLVMGMLDIGQLVYARSLLSGAVEEAARSNSLETADTDASELVIERVLSRIAPGVEVEASYTSYFDFADIDRPEQLEDENGNGLCDDGETYTDENNNDEWDADIGVDGNGGANDVVLFTVTATVPRLFKPPFLTGEHDFVISASSVRKNQPFATQEDYLSTAKTCEEEA